MEHGTSGKTSGNGNGNDSAAHAGVPDAREKLINDMKSVIGEAENWLQKSGGQAGDGIDSVKEKFDTTLYTAKTDLLRLESNMMAKTKLAAQATDTYVKDNPWISVGAGAVAGLVFGLLLGRK